MKHSLLSFCIILLFFGCKEPEARRPVTQKTTNVFLETINENKKLNELENNNIKNWISKDSINTYLTSPNGFWYTYKTKIEVASNFPKIGDVVTLAYDIKELNGKVLYSKEELGEKIYKVGKEDFIPALQDGIKLMKIGETITFVIPSYQAFGIAGDGNKIDINKTIISTVTLIDIKLNTINESN